MGTLTPEQIIEKLTAENATLKAANGQLSDAVKAAENKVLILTKSIDKLNNELKESHGVAAELSAELEKVTASNPNATPTATHKKITYDIVHGVKHEEKEYSPKEIAANADLVKKLVESGSSAVRAQITD